MRCNVLRQRRRRRQLPAADLARVLLVLLALCSDVHRGRDLLRVRNVQLALGVKVHIVVPPHLVLVDKALLAEDAGVWAFTRMKSRMNRQRSLLGESFAADVTHERNRNLSVVLHVTLQVLQVFKDPIAHLAGHYPRQSVLKFVLHDALRVPEGQIAVPALGFRNFRFVLGLDVLHRDCKRGEVVGTETAEAGPICFRFGARLLVFRQFFLKDERSRATLANERLSGKMLGSSTMIQQVSDRRKYFTTTFASVAASFQVISTLVQRQRGGLHERSATLGADECVTLCVNILVFPETTKQRI